MMNKERGLTTTINARKIFLFSKEDRYEKLERVKPDS